MLNMKRFAKFYLIVFAVVFIINLIRYILCSYYQKVYNLNFKNKTETKNFRIKPFIYPLFKQGDIEILSSKIDIIANRTYIEDFNKAFESAKGVFLHNIFLSFIWPWLAIQTLSMFKPIEKINNKIFKLFIGIFEIFIAYLVGLFLDTTGIGNKILKSLLAVLYRIFDYTS